MALGHKLAPFLIQLFVLFLLLQVYLGCLVYAVRADGSGGYAFTAYAGLLFLQEGPQGTFFIDLGRVSDPGVLAREQGIEVLHYVGVLEQSLQGWLYLLINVVVVVYRQVLL